jgi:hypothetical protein
VSETLQIWLFAVLGAGVLGSFYWQWAHRQDCETKRLENVKRLTDLESDVTRLFEEVGRRHNEGMRHRLHKVEGRVRLVLQKMGMEAGDDD